VRAFAVVVEQLRGEFKVFGEALGGLRQQMTDGFDESTASWARSNVISAR
jgi:hypothetical protein